MDFTVHITDFLLSRVWVKRDLLVLEYLPIHPVTANPRSARQPFGNHPGRAEDRSEVVRIGLHAVSQPEDRELAGDKQVL
jgi:hypothetical protein